MKILGIEFAPLRIPLKRRLQTLGVFQYTMSFLFLGFGCLFLSIYLLFTRFFYIPILYSVWYMYDRKTSARGGRRSQWFRKTAMWKYYCDYFPIKLIKTADLDPKKNYIFGCHPHGVMCYSHFINFASEASNFSEIFPGIKSHLLALAGHFQFPFYRDYFMLSGAVEVTKESLNWLLSDERTGNGAAIMIGGSLEALNAYPGTYRLVIKEKKGFCKVALRHGASICPVFSFGENDLYVQVPNPEGSLLRKVQEKMTWIFGFSPPFFHGRGMFNYTFGLLPYRKPIFSVVGKPIEVAKIADPTQEDIDKLHSTYLESLIELFETNKTKYGVKESEQLVFL